MLVDTLLCCFLFLSVMPAAKAATSVSISLSIYGQSIPESTTLLSPGVIATDGYPVYRVQIKATISGAPSNIAGRQLTFNNLNTSSCSLVRSDPIQRDGSNYVAYALYEVKSTTSFNCTASISDGTFIGSRTATFKSAVACGYTKPFYITVYYVPKESLCTGPRDTIATGIPNEKFKSSFLSEVRMEGCGLTMESRYLQHDAGRYYYVNAPKNALGGDLVVGKSIAVNHRYVPRLSAQRGTVSIGGGVGRRQADDSGGAITQWKIDVFIGPDPGSYYPAWNSKNQSVYYYGNNVY